MAKEFDEILECVGSYGYYQKWMILIFFMPISFFVGFTMNLMLFQVVVPDHWCYVPGRENTTLSPEEWRALTLPRAIESEKYSSCLMYKGEWSEDDGANYTVTNETQECISGWQHDLSQFTTTLSTAYEWVCEREIYSQHVLSITMAGNTVGTFLFPLLADKYLGRHSVFFLTLATHIVFTLPYCWVSNIGLHLTLRFFQGLSFESNYLMPYTIVLEVVSPDHRALVIMLSFISWTFGMCFTALVAWLIPNWQYLALISCLPSLLGFLYWRYLPESPRWLLSKGRLGQCVDILLEIAWENGKEGVSRRNLEEELKCLTLTQPEEMPFTQALAYPKLRLRAILVFLMMYSVFVVYGILMLGINVMPSNYFLSHFILSISELPSNFLGWIITHYLGRRFMCWFTYILLAVFSVAATFCAHDEWLLLIVLALAKLLATQGLYVIFVLASEIFPTPVRTSGIGLTIVFGMLGMVVCPYVLNSGLGATFQYWVMAGLSLMSLLLSLQVPETIGLPLPQTFQEAENLGAGRPLSAWIHHWNKNEYPTPSPLHLLPDHQQELKELNPKKPFVE